MGLDLDTDTDSTGAEIWGLVNKVVSRIEAKRNETKGSMLSANAAHFVGHVSQQNDYF